MNSKFYKIMPTLLNIAGSCGVIATSVMVGFESIKNSDYLKEAIQSKDKKRIAKTFIKVYWPSAVVGTSTILSLVSGRIISKKYEASLSATCLMLDGAYHKYKNKVKGLIGEDGNKKILSEISKDEFKKKEQTLTKNNKIGDLPDGRRLYYEEHIGWFLAKPENMAKAIHIASERVAYEYVEENGNRTSNFCSLRIFLEDAKAELLDWERVDAMSFDYGWDYDYVNETHFGHMFLNYTEDPICDEKTGVVLYYVLVFDKDPVYLNNTRPSNERGNEVYDVHQIDEFIQEEPDYEGKRG